MSTRKIEKMNRWNTASTKLLLVLFAITFITAIPAICTKDIEMLKTIGVTLAILALWAFMNMLLSLYILHLRLQLQYKQNTQKRKQYIAPSLHPDCKCTTVPITMPSPTFVVTDLEIIRPGTSRTPAHERIQISAMLTGFGNTSQIPYETLVKVIHTSIDKLNYPKNDKSSNSSNS